MSVQVGWFLHTPFPSSEIYRTLPVREEVLRAVLKSDLIGFHTYDYARHFVSACTRILGLEVRTSSHSLLHRNGHQLFKLCSLSAHAKASGVLSKRHACCLDENSPIKLSVLAGNSGRG